MIESWRFFHEWRYFWGTIQNKWWFDCDFANAGIPEIPAKLFSKNSEAPKRGKNWSPSTSIPNQKWLTLESTNQPTSYPRSPKIITPQIDTVGGKTSCTSWYRKYPIYMVSYCEVVDILVIRSRMVSHNCLVTIGFGEPRNMKKTLIPTQLQRWTTVSINIIRQKHKNTHLFILNF